MGYIRSALYLDFDNVFSGLFKLDPEAAIQFAEAPGVWLARLSNTALTADGPRRWLMLRCYLNPAGKVKHPNPPPQQPWLFFSKFRPSFVRAGFEVIDCPLYNATKNAADIRIVVDAVDALAADTRYEEFVIASGDSDMTPLLQRLRRADRRTVIVSPAVTAEAYTAIADQALDSQHLLALIQGEPVDDVDDTGCDTGTAQADNAQAYESFRTTVTAEYEQAAVPLNKASLAQRLRDTLAEEINHTNWFGLGGFSRAVQSLRLPNLRMSDHLLWDDSRHDAPEPATPAIALPEPVERLAEQLSLPKLPPSSWPAIYETLSDYAQSHKFNMTECTSWARDQLREQDIPVSRSAVAFVVRGTSFGGYPLYRQPAPTADEIREAFVSNVFSRAEAAEIVFTGEEHREVRVWLGEQEQAPATPA